MARLNRRAAVQALGVGLGTLGFPSLLSATLARGLSLGALSKTSDCIVSGIALDARAHFAWIGGQRRIVTDTRFAVREVLARNAPEDSEILVRTLGGEVGDLGQLVHGEALLELGLASLLFLTAQQDGIRHVMGMAQGHYRVIPDAASVPRLRPSPRLPRLLSLQGSAVAELSGRELGAARELILQSLHP